MAMQKATVGTVAVIAIVSLMVSALGALVATHTISNSGRLVTLGVGIYSDSGCATQLSTIGWGTLNPGDVKTCTMYVRNEGNVPVSLKMTVDNWSPPTASTYITLTWNKESAVLSTNQVVEATVTLTVSSNISGVTSFNFDITITGIE